MIALFSLAGNSFLVKTGYGYFYGNGGFIDE
jgi:hypothetical protein